MKDETITKLFVAYFIILAGLTFYAASLNPNFLKCPKKKKAKIELTENQIEAFEKLHELNDTSYVEN
jgi:hypothetical protein